MKDVIQLKNDFNCVKVLRGDILNVFDTLESKLQVLKKIYLQLLGHNNESAYMFGIDSFYFQNKLIECEFTNLKDMQRFIENRMYCEYYQLHMLVQEYVSNDVASENVRNKIAVRKKYPAYKNLDPRKIYNFQLVIELHDHIIISIMELETHRQAKVAELENDTAQSKLGLNIGNLVNSHRFDNALLKEKICMFISFLQVFHEHHTKYFTRLSIKAKLVIGIINEDIQIKQFNPTGNDLPAPNTFGSNATNDQQNGMSEQQTIKSFVNCDNSGEEGGLKTALDNIVLNIPNAASCSRGMFAPGNNTPTGNYGNKEEQEQNIIISTSDPTTGEQVATDRGDEGCSDHLSVSAQSNTIVSEASDLDDGAECILTELDVGKRVLVEGYDSIGTLRFLGKHHTKNVTRCGVEMDDKVGKNNGTVDGFVYFETDHERGILVAPRKVTLVDEIEHEL